VQKTEKEARYSFFVYTDTVADWFSTYVGPG